jgi:ATP-dependent NAD(P)H-hydrate dehydratase
LQCDAEGGLKRMGGQGDVLTGVIAAFLAWGKAYQEGVWRYISYNFTLISFKLTQ